MEVLLLIIGLFLLIKGSDFFVDGASDIAKICKIPSLIIGLTIVAFGTSAPEAAVSISASINKNSDIAIGNIVGSNIFNLLMVIGVSALIKKVSVDKNIIKRDYPYNIFATIVLLLCAIITLSSKTKTISQLEGIVLLILFAIFMTYTIYGALKERKDANDIYEESKHSLLTSIVLSILGIAMVIGGGELTVQSASDIAKTLGVSDKLIALTIVAIGTSLPELVTSVTALKKGENDIAIGNVIGSNIFNILFIIGISATIRPLSVDFSSITDCAILLFVNMAVYLMAFKNKSFSKISGAFMVLMYIAFSLFIILR